MTLYASDMVREFDARLFFDYETYGENLMVLTVPNEQDENDVIKTMVEFHDDMVSASAIVLELQEDFYLKAIRVCNTLNAGTRWYKHFVQETPEGMFQLCVAADFMAVELGSDACFDRLMAFVRHLYEVKEYLFTNE